MNNINSVLQKKKKQRQKKNNQDTYSNQNASFIKNDNFHTMNSNILEGKEDAEKFMDSKNKQASNEEKI